MNDEDLIRVLDHRADEVFPPADLLASLDRRYSQWRTRTTSLIGTVAVVLVAALVVTIAAIRTGGAEPANVVPSPIPFKVPSKLADNGPVASVFPGATFQVPKQTPDGRDFTFVAPIDGTHLLAFITEHNSQYSDFASYDLTTRTFGPNLSRVSLGYGSGFAYGERYWVWGSRQNETTVISKVALATGRVTTVATVSGMTEPYAGWYTDGKWLYTSSALGVERLPLDGGSFQPVRGLEDMQMRDDSPWAVRTAGSPVPAPAQTGSPQISTTLGSVDTELRNVETGQVVHITVPPDAMGLICAPTICLGFDSGSRSFIQRPDGSDRVRLPAVPLDLGDYLDQPWHLLCTSGGALVVAGNLPQVFLDPYTGVYAATGLHTGDVPPSGVGFFPYTFASADTYSTNALYAGWTTHDEVIPGRNYISTSPDTILLPGLLTGP